MIDLYHFFISLYKKVEEWSVHRVECLEMNLRVICDREARVMVVFYKDRTRNIRVYPRDSSG